MAIVLRSVKGSPLTISEVDGNFTTLDNGKLDKTGGTSLYLGTGANSTRFPNALSVISNTAVGIQQNEPHNAGLISEGTGSSLTTTISGTSGATSITVGSATGIMIGQLITGTGIAPNATVTNIVSTTITVSFANIGAVSGTGTFSNIGVGVYGVGYTAGAARSGGVVGEGHVSATGDAASAIGVRGYAHDTHAGGLNIGLYGDAANGSSSYALYLNRGDIYSAAAQTWSLNGNLSFSGAYTVTIPTLSLGNALPIASGGTGATSAASALTALGAYASSNPSGYTSNAGTVTSVGGTSPISSSGGTAPTISISQSGSGSNGYLSSTDWSTFNGKQSAIGTISGLVKGNGVNLLTAAVAGTDYLAAVAPGTSGNVLTSNGSTWVSGAAPVSVSTGDIEFSMNSSAHTSPTYLPCTSSKYTSSSYSTLAANLTYSDWNNQMIEKDSNTSEVFDVWYTGSIWIAVTRQGIYKSTDGTTWTVKTRIGINPSSGAGACIAFNGTSTFVVSFSNNIITSTDSGDTWTVTRAGNYSSLSTVRCPVVYGGSNFVVCQNGGIYYSTDGVTWNTSTGTLPTGGANRLYYLNGTYVAFYNGSTNLYYSTTAASGWASISAGAGNNIRDITHGNSWWMCTVGTSGSYYINASIANLFSSGSTFPTAGDYQSVVYAATTGKWVAVSGGGTIAYSGTSNPNSGFTSVTGLLSIPYYKILTDGTNYIATTYDGNQYKSTNGTTWTGVFDYRLSYNGGNDSAFYGRYLNGTFIWGNPWGCVMSSTDLTTFTPRLNTSHIPVYESNGSNGKNVVENASLIVMGASNGVVTTTDNITFTYRPFFPGWGNNVAYGNNIYVMSGYTSSPSAYVAWYSSNGTSWTQSSTGFSNQCYGLVFGNNIFAMLIAGNGIYTSTDGNTWTSRTSDNSATTLYFYDGYFVTTRGNIMYRSSDAITWVQIANSIPVTTTQGSWKIVNGSLYGVSASNELRVTFAGGRSSSTYACRVGQSASVTQSSISTLTYGNGVYVFASNPYNTNGNYAVSKIFYSLDGINFSPALFPNGFGSQTQNNVTAIRYVNSLFVAVSEDGFVHTSADGIRWNTYKQDTVFFDSIDWITIVNGNIALLGYQKIIVPSTTTFRTPLIGYSAYIKT